MKFNPMPVITITPTTRVVCRSAPWRAWVSVYRGFNYSHGFTFTPPVRLRITSNGGQSVTWPTGVREVLFS